MAICCNLFVGLHIFFACGAVGVVSGIRDDVKTLLLDEVQALKSSAVHLESRALRLDRLISKLDPEESLSTYINKLGQQDHFLACLALSSNSHPKATTASPLASGSQNINWFNSSLMPTEVEVMRMGGQTRLALKVQLKTGASGEVYLWRTESSIAFANKTINGSVWNPNYSTDRLQNTRVYFDLPSDHCTNSSSEEYFMLYGNDYLSDAGLLVDPCPSQTVRDNETGENSGDFRMRVRQHLRAPRFMRLGGSDTIRISPGSNVTIEYLVEFISGAQGRAVISGMLFDRAVDDLISFQMEAALNASSGELMFYSYLNEENEEELKTIILVREQPIGWEYFDYAYEGDDFVLKRIALTVHSHQVSGRISFSSEIRYNTEGGENELVKSFSVGQTTLLLKDGEQFPFPRGRIFFENMKEKQSCIEYKNGIDFDYCTVRCFATAEDIQSISLRCHDRPTYELPSGFELKNWTFMHSASAQLLIPSSVGPEMNGFYVCEATTSSGTVSTQVIELEYGRSPSIMSNQIEFINHDNITAELRCTARGYPPPKIEFDLSITRSDVSETIVLGNTTDATLSISHSQQATSAALTITMRSLQWPSQYVRCKAENLNGYDSVFFYLYSDVVPDYYSSYY